MNINHNGRFVRLTSSRDWRRLARDHAAEVWITALSWSDIQRFEPIASLQAEPSSEIAAQKLRGSDHAAFVIVNKERSQVTIECRPRAADRIYLCQNPDGIDIAAGIQNAPIATDSAQLSRRFIAIWMANALRLGSFDHFLGCSPFEGVSMVTQGLTAEYDSRRGELTISFLQDELQSNARAGTLCDAVEHCRVALTKCIETATHEAAVVAECSGGIDSGLVSVIASRAAKDSFKGGAFADYPYHEFREERSVAQCVAAYGGFELLQLDPKLTMCWGVLNRPEVFRLVHEPSLMLPYFGQVLALGELIDGSESTAILTGLGGDLLFQDRDLAFSLGSRPKWVSEEIWDILLAEMHGILEWIQSPNRISSGYAFANPWMSRTLVNMYPKAIYYSPLSAHSVIEAITDLRSHLRTDGEKFNDTTVQKPLAHAAFVDYLPEQLWRRRWKVNFVGLQYRFWYRFGREFVELASRMRQHLETLGLNSKAVVCGFQELAQGRNSCDRLLNALATYLFWLDKFLANHRFEPYTYLQAQ